MDNKPHKNWGEIQLAIAAVALTATLAFWNLFSVPQKQQVVAQATDTALPPPQDPTEVPTQAPTPTLGFIPVKIIFGGTAPQQQVIVQAAPAQPKRKSGGGGGGGSVGGGGSAPQPPVSTGSSKP